MIIRKNQAKLSTDEKRRFTQAIITLKARGQYDQYVSWHKDIINALGGHFGSAFFPWHRTFLVKFEQDLRRIDSSVSLPYWDWSIDNSKTSSPWVADLMGGDGSSSDHAKVMDGPFAYDRGNWPINVRDSGDPQYLQREIGQHADTLPTVQDVLTALDASPYDVAPWDSTSQSGFRNRVEGFIPPPDTVPKMHNRVHEWVGGTMRPLGSPNDPVFWLHHCFVDKLWADWQVWQLQVGADNYHLYLPLSGARSGNNLDDPMPPWNQPHDTVTPRDVLYNHGQLDYRYDTDNDMQPFDELRPGQQLYSARGAQYYLEYAADGDLAGNLALKSSSPSSLIWASSRTKKPVGKCVLESNGNLVTYGPSGAKTWESSTGGVEPPGPTTYRLVVQPRTVVIYGADGKSIWSQPSK
jgi:tyrosinase